MNDREDRLEEYEEPEIYREDEYEEEPEATDGSEEDEDSAYDEDEEYDEDVFSLEEDLRREHRKQWVQYLVFAVCAAIVVGLALYGSIVLTHSRLEAQRGIEVVNPAGTPLPGQTGKPGTPQATAAPVDYWPSALFPGVPVLQSAAYETTVKDGYAQVAVPSETAKGFDQYIADLVDAGAAVYVRTTRLSVLVLDGVEIHLVDNNLESKVVLCGESAIGWNDEGYAAFPLPDSGNLISVEEGVGAGSRVLTYRLATTLDALAYTSQLMDEGWTISGSLEPTNNIFTTALKKNNLQITVDYFSTGDNYLVRLDFLN